MPPRKLDTQKRVEEQKYRAREFYTSGLSLRQVGTLMNLSSGYLSKICADITRTRSEANQLRQPPISNHWRAARAQARKVWIRNGRHIPKSWHIHHIDGDFTNNTLENLECLSASDHARKHHPSNPFPRDMRVTISEYRRQPRLRQERYAPTS